MKPISTMFFGAAVFVACCALYVAGLDAAFVPACAGAALFGKGYGIWEERTRS